LSRLRFDRARKAGRVGPDGEQRFPFIYRHIAGKVKGYPNKSRPVWSVEKLLKGYKVILWFGCPGLSF
jgi:hypothetical protein